MEISGNPFRLIFLPSDSRIKPFASFIAPRLRLFFGQKADLQNICSGSCSSLSQNLTPFERKSHDLIFSLQCAGIRPGHSSAYLSDTRGFANSSPNLYGH
jgi:hypothetical protein